MLIGLGPAGAAADPETPRELLTSLWRDAPEDPSRVRIDPIPTVDEPSDILLHDGRFYVVSDKHPMIFHFDVRPDAPPALKGRWAPAGLPAASDLEAIDRLPGGEVLIASERNGAIFVLSPFPDKVCAAWMSGVDSNCFVGPDNCGIEAIAVIPGGRIFEAKERDARAAWVYDLPGRPCEGGALGGRTYLKLPDEVGPDISAALFHPASGHLLVVARARQKVLEFEVPAATPGDTSPRPLRLLGAFHYPRSEGALDYPGIFFNQVEGIAVDDNRVLYLIVDNNHQVSRRFGDRRAALIRFFPVTP